MIKKKVHYPHRAPSTVQLARKRNISAATSNLSASTIRSAITYQPEPFRLRDLEIMPKLDPARVALFLTTVWCDFAMGLRMDPVVFGVRFKDGVNSWLEMWDPPVPEGTRVLLCDGLVHETP